MLCLVCKSVMMHSPDAWPSAHLPAWTCSLSLLCCSDNEVSKCLQKCDIGSQLLMSFGKEAAGKSL